MRAQTPTGLTVPPTHARPRGHCWSGIVARMTETEAHHSSIETLLDEERRYRPTPEFATEANAKPEIYDRDPLDFWADEARSRVTWFEPFETVCGAPMRAQASIATGVSGTMPM